jgi:hypothetical protein
MLGVDILNCKHCHGRRVASLELALFFLGLLLLLQLGKTHQVGQVNKPATIFDTQHIYRVFFDNALAYPRPQAPKKAVNGVVAVRRGRTVLG